MVKSASVKSLRRLLARLKRGKAPTMAPFLRANHYELDFPAPEGAQAGNQWDSLLSAVVRELNHEPMTFLRQPAISRTVHPNQQDLAHRYLSELRADQFFQRHILPRLHDVPMGDPWLCEFFPFASPITIQHAYYLNLMREHFGFFLPDNVVSHVVEVGGGYGNFCRIAKSFGFRGRYIILDLPEMQRMQRHYLSHVFSEEQVSDFLEFGSIDTPTFLPKAGPSLLMATFSLSEMPLDTRRQLEAYFRNFDYLFFAYNAAFDGVDNVLYFSTLADNLGVDYHVDQFADPHRRAWFLLCSPPK